MQAGKCNTRPPVHETHRRPMVQGKSMRLGTHEEVEDGLLNRRSCFRNYSNLNPLLGVGKKQYSQTVECSPPVLTLPRTTFFLLLEVQT